MPRSSARTVAESRNTATEMDDRHGIHVCWHGRSPQTLAESARFGSVSLPSNHLLIRQNATSRIVMLNSQSAVKSCLLSPYPCHSDDCSITKQSFLPRMTSSPLQPMANFVYVCSRLAIWGIYALSYRLRSLLILRGKSSPKPTARRAIAKIEASPEYC